jgi:hypothetical protein
MAELLDLVSKPASQFSSDMAEWLNPPQRPQRPTSRRHKTGFRNSVAFGLFWIAIIMAGSFALSGSAPNPYTIAASILIAIVVGLGNYRNERRLANKEDAFLLQAHLERYRAYLVRRRVWKRLRYCPKCAWVTDLVTLQSSSLFDVHELANSKIKEASGISTRG